MHVIGEIRDSVRSIYSLEQRQPPGKKKKDLLAGDEPSQVSFFDLFYFSTVRERLFICLGFIFVVGGGCSPLIINILYGEFGNMLIDRTSPKPGVPSSETVILQFFGGGKILVNASEEVRLHSLREDSFAWGVGCFVVSSIQTILCLSGVFLFSFIASTQIKRIKGILFSSILCKDLAWFDLNVKGNFLTKCHQNLIVMEKGIGNVLAIFMYQMVAGFTNLLVSFLYGWLLSLILSLLLFPLMVPIYLQSKVQDKLNSKEVIAFNKASDLLEEVLNHIKTVVAFEGEKKEVSRYAQTLEESRKIAKKREVLVGISQGLLWFIIYNCYTVAFAVGIRIILVSRENQTYHFTPGDLFTVFFGMVAGVVNIGFGSAYVGNIKDACSSASFIFHVIRTKSLINPCTKDGSVFKNFYGDIEFKNVHFAYPLKPNKKVLKGLNMKIKPGEVVAIVGEHNSGKTTVLNLVLRFYDPNLGAVFLDGYDSVRLNVTWVRRHIGFVAEEPFLINGTIYDNISYGNPSSTESEVYQAAKDADCHDFIIKLEKEYSTVYNKKTSTLSLSQKQKIALARALVRDPKILILDDVTSWLEPGKDHSLLSSVDAAVKGRTTLIVTKRVSTISQADRIIVMDDGDIVEEGPHDELLKLRGVYYRLLRSGHESKEKSIAPEIESMKYLLVDNEDEKHDETQPLKKIEYNRKPTKPVKKGRKKKLVRPKTPHEGSKAKTSGSSAINDENVTNIPVEQSGAVETSKSIEQNKSTEQSKSLEASKSTEQSKSLEANKSTEQSKSLETNKSSDQSKSVEKNKSVETSNSIETSKSIDRRRSVDGSKSIDRRRSVDRSKSIDQSKSIDRSKSVERSKLAIRSKSVEKTKSHEKYKPDKTRPPSIPEEIESPTDLEDLEGVESNETFRKYKKEKIHKNKKEKHTKGGEKHEKDEEHTKGDEKHEKDEEHTKEGEKHEKDERHTKSGEKHEKDERHTKGGEKHEKDEGHTRSGGKREKDDKDDKEEKEEKEEREGKEGKDKRERKGGKGGKNENDIDSIGSAEFNESKKYGHRMSFHRRRTSFVIDSFTSEQPPVPYSRIIHWSKPDWCYVLAGFISAIVGGTSLPAACFMFGDAFRVLALSDNKEILERSNYYALYLLIIAAVAGICIFVQIYCFTVVAINLSHRLRVKALDSILNQEIAWFEEQKQSKIHSLRLRLARDPLGVELGIGSSLGLCVQSGASMLIGVLLSFIMEWRIALLTLATLPLLALAIFTESILLREPKPKEKFFLNRITEIGLEVISNIKIVAAFGKENMYTKRYKAALNRVTNLNFKASGLTALSFALSQTAPFYSYSITLWFGGFLVSTESIDVSHAITISELLIFGAWTLAQCGVLAPFFLEARKSAGRLMYFFLREPLITDGHINAFPDMKKEGVISYSKVFFASPNQPNVDILKGLNFTITCGKSIGIIGPVGSGKTSMLQLLLRFYDPKSGVILVNDIDIRNFKLSHLRKKVGIVSQEPALFSRTIIDNIAYGDNSRIVPFNEIETAARAANIHDFIVSLPKGYNTPLSLILNKMSLGQKQQLAFARMMIRKPQVLLLDSCTSYFDKKTETIVQRVLDRNYKRKGKTVIRTSLRLKNPKNVDTVGVLVGGSIMEYGTHLYLMQIKGLYYLLQSDDKPERAEEDDYSEPGTSQG